MHTGQKNLAVGLEPAPPVTHAAAWKDAVIEACRIHCVVWIEHDPRATVARLLEARSRRTDASAECAVAEAMDWARVLAACVARGIIDEDVVRAGE